MKVLWLCSWYPHTTDPFDGDFIERHAAALSLYQSVDVIHIVQNVHFNSNSSKPAEEKATGRLHSKVYYVKLPGTGSSYLDTLIYNRRYIQKARLAIKEYMQANGKPDLVHVHVPVKAGAIALRMRRLHGVPFVVTEHTSAYFQHIENNFFTRSRLFKLVTKRSFAKAEAVISVSNWLLNRLKELFSIKQTKLIRNAVDTGLFFPVAVNSNVPHFIHVSMMLPLKNVNGILEALALLNRVNSNWQMSFIGPSNDEYILLAKELGLENQVLWKGAMNYAGVAKEMQQADVLVHFSKYENLPCVVNEALCCGLPVISSNVGGIAELVHENNGILVENGNIQELANALLSYLRQPERFHKDMISKEVADAFSYQTIGKQLYDFYREVLKTG